jgi:hypothetical protein
MKSNRQNKKLLKIKKTIKNKNQQSCAKFSKKYGGAPPKFITLPALDILTNLNVELKRKCPELEIQVGMMNEMTGTLHVYTQKAKALVVCLYHKDNCVSSIQVTKDFDNEFSVEIRSFTYDVYNFKKYNTLLRYATVLLCSEILMDNDHITTIHSYAINPISAHLMMTKFNAEISLNGNDEFDHFYKTVYVHTDEPNSKQAVEQFYKKYNYNLGIGFDIHINKEMVDNSLEKYKTLIDSQLICAE